MLVALFPIEVFFWTGFCCLGHCHVLGHLSCRGLRSAELHLDVFLRMWFPEQRCVEIKKEVLARSCS